MLLLYKVMTYLGTPFLGLLLHYRLSRGKEDKKRLGERRGIPSRTSPKGHLVWLHAASVGEAQSALILIEKILLMAPATNFLVTSGTTTSAALMEKRLPEQAFHQYYPLDNPVWVNRFLDYWQPDLALWMESELWPNMLQAIKTNHIPAVLVNARLSNKSFGRWVIFKAMARKLLSTFSLVMTQTEQDATHYKSLGADNVIVTDNIKNSAAPLPVNPTDLEALLNVTKNRPLWLYASTHDGEEAMACRLHTELKEKHPDLLTIIVPRHPERRQEIKQQCKIMGLKTFLRGVNKDLPLKDTDIYIADTLGELGLFYRLSPIAMIGRSFSNDGGGGHNPIEAAQLGCAVLTGPNIQYQTQLFDDMLAVDAVLQIKDEAKFLETLGKLLSDKQFNQTMIDNAAAYAKSKSDNIDKVMQQLAPFIPSDKKEAA